MSLFPLLEQLHWATEDVKLASRDTADFRSREVIAGNLTLTGHYYWLEEQLSAGDFGTNLNHSRYTTSVADGAHLLTCMIGGFEDFCDRLVEPQKSLEYSNLAISQCWSS